MRKPWMATAAEARAEAKELAVRLRVADRHAAPLLFRQLERARLDGANSSVVSTADVGRVSESDDSAIRRLLRLVESLGQTVQRGATALSLLVREGGMPLATRFAEPGDSFQISVIHSGDRDASEPVVFENEIDGHRALWGACLLVPHHGTPASIVFPQIRRRALPRMFDLSSYMAAGQLKIRLHFTAPPGSYALMLIASSEPQFAEQLARTADSVINSQADLVDAIMILLRDEAKHGNNLVVRLTHVEVASG